MDQLGHRFPRRSAGVLRCPKRLGGDDAMTCEHGDDVVDGRVLSVGRVARVGRQVAQFVEGDLRAHGRDVVAGVGGVHQGGQRPPGDGPLLRGQFAQGAVAPRRHASADRPDAPVRLVGQVSVLPPLPQLAERHLQQGQHGDRRLTGDGRLGRDVQDVADDPLGQPWLEAESHVQGGQDDDVVQVLLAQGARHVQESRHRGLQQPRCQGRQLRIKVVPHDQDHGDLGVGVRGRGDLVDDGQELSQPAVAGLDEELLELVDDQQDALVGGLGRQPAVDRRHDPVLARPRQPRPLDLGQHVLPRPGENGQPPITPRHLP
ncbi:hypothetical protein PV408_35310, partial [Streptomyces sp. ME18-1-4]|nr:hypothetical protein [Streptomyces sp. ME18-1-4]